MLSPTIQADDGLQLTVAQLLRARVAELGNAEWLVCDDERITYAEADRRSAVLARGLLAIGVKHGTHVGLIYPNGVDYLVAWLAIVRVGAVATPFSSFSTAREFHNLINHGRVEVLLATSAFRAHRYDERLQEALPGLRFDRPPPPATPEAPKLREIFFSGAGMPERDPGWSIDRLIGQAPKISEDALRRSEDAVRLEDRLGIIHTSGSTSAPKGVIHRHGQLIRHVNNLNEIRGHGRGHTLFCNSPFFWVGGMAYSLLGTLVAGGRLLCSNAAKAGDMLDVIERERPDLVNGFAATVAHLAADPTFARRDFSFIKRGNLYPIAPHLAPKDPELRHNMLGMTETGSVCLLDGDENEVPERLRGSFGKAAPGFETRVVDPDTGKDCAHGEPGELWFRGPFLMEGYLGKETESFDAEGWFHTGDLVARDAEGYFYFKGRRGDMIKTAGANVSPREVESVLTEVTGLRSHVIGVDDPARGQLVVAVLVAPPEAALNEQALRARLAGKLSSYKVPRHFVRMAETEVPMLSTGKIDGKALKQELARRIQSPA